MSLTMICGSLATLIPRILETLPCDVQICPYHSTNDNTASITTTSSSTDFHAPLYSGLMVFLASSLGIPIYYIWIKATISPSSVSISSIQNKALWLKLIIPSFLNVSGTVVQLIALLFIPAAVLAGMRGVLILLTALFSKITKLPDAPQTNKEWFYIGLSIFATILIGSATIAETTSTTTTTISTVSMTYGILFCILGYTLASGQATLEAHTLDSGINKWIILGIEGIIGSISIIIILIILSFFTSNSLEQPQHTVCCIQHNPEAYIPLSISYGGSSLIFNTLLLTLSSLLGANLRVFIFTARGILTLIIETSLYYISSDTQPYGTIATPWLSLELIGFLILIYSGLARVQLQTQRTTGTGTNTTNNIAKYHVPNGTDDDDNDHKQTLLSSSRSESMDQNTLLESRNIRIIDPSMSRSSLSLHYNDNNKNGTNNLKHQHSEYDTSVMESLLVLDVSRTNSKQ